MKLNAATMILVTVLMVGPTVSGQQPVVIDIDAPDRQVFIVGVPDIAGGSNAAKTVTKVLRNDLFLMPGYRVRDGAAQKGLDIDATTWSSRGAHGVITGQARAGGTELELRFYRLAASVDPPLTKTYRGKAADARGWAHDFVNEVLRKLTGVPGPFGTQIAFARKIKPGRKDVYAASMDGNGVRRVSRGIGVAMLPTFGKNHIWYTQLTRTGSFITHGDAGRKRIIVGPSTNMAPSVCDGRVYFASSRDGNSEIYSARTDGTGVKRLTRNRAIDVSPACGPGGKLAFVSNRHGSPQIFVMNRDGSGTKRVTFRGSHNQTPAWCMDPDNPTIAFTGRDKGFDVFTVNLKTKQYTRVTHGSGSNKDPAFSPDCRLLAFSSTRRGGAGVYLSSPDGLEQHLIIKGTAETIRWSQH